MREFWKWAHHTSRTYQGTSSCEPTVTATLNTRCHTQPTTQFAACGISFACPTSALMVNYSVHPCPGQYPYVFRSIIVGILSWRLHLGQWSAGAFSLVPNGIGVLQLGQIYMFRLGCRSGVSDDTTMPPIL